MTYHSGSRAVQDRVGVRDLADHVGQAVGQGIRPVAAAFLEQQPMLVAGAADPATGEVWASLLTGPPGFVRATGVRQISVTGVPAEGDPLAAALATEGTLVGTIALDPRTRRRMRLNGRSRPTARGFAVEADRVFANCPKYLQRRESYEAVERRPGDARRSGRLSPGSAPSSRRPTPSSWPPSTRTAPTPATGAATPASSTRTTRPNCTGATTPATPCS